MDMTNQEGSHSAQYVVSSWFGVRFSKFNEQGDPHKTIIARGHNNHSC